MAHVYFWHSFKDSGFPARVNHAAAAINDPNTRSPAIISVGGYHADVQERLNAREELRVFKSTPIDMHKLDHASKQWTEVFPKHDVSYGCQKSTIPRSRYGHSVCFYSGKVYMYGGRNDEDGCFSAVVAYDIAENIWHDVKCRGSFPPALCGHAACVVENRMYIHGGFADEEEMFSTGFYCFDLDSAIWKKIDVSGVHVRERDFHTIVAVGKVIYLYGGRSDDAAPHFSGRSYYDSSFYAFNLCTEEWMQLLLTGYRPKGRRSHIACTYGQYIVYFGGYHAHWRSHFGDLFLHDTSTNNIVHVNPLGEGPCPRRRMCCALLGTSLYIFGGTSDVIVDSGDRTIVELQDLSDMYLLSLVPSLQERCLTMIICNKLDISTLPQHIKTVIAKLVKDAEQMSRFRMDSMG